MNRFIGKTALVTGGSSGIGAAVAQAYAREGAQVIITGRDLSSLAKIAETLGPKSLALKNDASVHAQARDLGVELERRGMRLDAVFINAGVARLGPLETVDEATWDASFNTNVKGPYFQIQGLLPVLNEGAAVVLNGSINAHIGMPGSSVYAASKAALISLAKTLSAELLPRGVRVNVVSPGPISTPLYGKLGLDEKTLQVTASRIRSQVPLGRFGTAEEVAATVLHLSAAESAFIVGSEVILDGGMSQL